MAVVEQVARQQEAGERGDQQTKVDLRKNSGVGVVEVELVKVLIFTDYSTD